MAEETKNDQVSGFTPPLPDDLNKKDRQIMDIAQAIIETDDPKMVMSLNLLYIEKLLRRQNLGFKQPNKNCKRCYGTGWQGYVSMSKENKAKYKNQLPIACECVVDYKPQDSKYIVPKRSNPFVNRKRRRELMKLEQVFSKKKGDMYFDKNVIYRNPEENVPVNSVDANKQQEKTNG